jgi:O-antigen/teichoic acid export membrane protein
MVLNAGAGSSWKRTALGIAFVVIGLLGRALIDKLIALRGTPETVAVWAQLQSIVDLVCGVVLAGIGTGLSVLISRSETTDERVGLLNSALRLGLAIALPFALALAILGMFLSGWAGGDRMVPAVIVVAAGVGWLSVIPGLMNAFWLGEQRRGPMFLLAAVTNGLVVIAGLLAPPGVMLQSMLLAFLLPVAALGSGFLKRGERSRPKVRDSANDHALLRYLLPGLSIGIMSPLSWLFIRGFAAQAMSWQDVARMQALSRVSDWVTALAAAALYLFFLPRFSRAVANGLLPHELRRTAARVLIPSGVALLGLALLQQRILPALYDDSFIVSPAAAMLFYAGDMLRIISWVFLYALYALRRTALIAVGEFFSLPLFALLLALTSEGLTLEIAGALWVLTYFSYAGFNAWAVLRE